MPTYQQQLTLQVYTNEQLLAESNKDTSELQPLLKRREVWEHLSLVRFKLFVLSRQSAKDVFEGEYYFRLAKQDTQQYELCLRSAIMLNNLHALIEQLASHCDKRELDPALTCAQHLCQQYPAVGHYYLALVYQFLGLKNHKYLDQAMINMHCYHALLHSKNIPTLLQNDARQAMANAGLEMDENLCGQFCDQLDDIREHDSPMDEKTAAQLSNETKQYIANYINDYEISEIA